jgi:mannosyl-oligosaccharide alpha-1,2-mannosidase
VGAFADSAYEYMLKQWLLTGRSEPRALALCASFFFSPSHFCRNLILSSIYISDLKSARNIINNLLFLSPNRSLLYVTDLRGGIPSNNFEHLSCFLPGVFALGAQLLSSSPLDPNASDSQLGFSEREKQLHEWAARGLAYTCWLMYADQATGLGPDVVRMHSNSEGRNERWIDALERWEKDHQRTKHDVPPGLKEVEPERDPDKKDYYLTSPSYLLRPEVR